ncbi:MAG: hypothetical protein JWN02_147, partial [Acidobacteria bacterium]|nr:hypothetical protein [Acidobacteriota bacterium]
LIRARKIEAFGGEANLVPTLDAALNRAEQLLAGGSST